MWHSWKCTVRFASVCVCRTIWTSDRNERGRRTVYGMSENRKNGSQTLRETRGKSKKTLHKYERNLFNFTFRMNAKKITTMIWVWVCNLNRFSWKRRFTLWARHIIIAPCTRVGWGGVWGRAKQYDKVADSTEVSVIKWRQRSPSNPSNGN